MSLTSYVYTCGRVVTDHIAAMDRQFCLRWWWLLTITVIVLVVLLLGTLLPLVIHFNSSSSDGHSETEGCDCRYHCEWQMVQMNKTFNFLMTACEEKVQKLHKSDMNMAIIREQLNKEMLHLFLDEYQAMSHRLQNIREESIPQFCSDYCITQGLRCKESITKLKADYKRLSERQHRLKVQLQSRRYLQEAGNICVSQHRLIIGVLLLLCTVTLILCIQAIVSRRSRVKVSPSASYH